MIPKTIEPEWCTQLDKSKSNTPIGVTSPIAFQDHSRFKPVLTPLSILCLGAFNGSYFHDWPEYPYSKELPKRWMNLALKAGKISVKSNTDINYFKIKSGLERSSWLKSGWISEYDPLGWFEWYCKFYCGRRIPHEDHRQISRWCSYKRHSSAVSNTCPGDLSCHRRQRQSLIHWAYDPFI